MKITSSGFSTNNIAWIGTNVNGNVSIADDTSVFSFNETEIVKPNSVGKAFSLYEHQRVIKTEDYYYCDGFLFQRKKPIVFGRCYLGSTNNTTASGIFNFTNNTKSINTPSTGGIWCPTYSNPLSKVLSVVSGNLTTSYVQSRIVRDVTEATQFINNGKFDTSYYGVGKVPPILREINTLNINYQHPNITVSFSTDTSKFIIMCLSITLS